MSRLVDIVDRRTWHPELQTHVVIAGDGSGTGHGIPIWLNEMRVQCVESNEHAGFWRYDIGLYSVIVFRLAESDAFTTSIEYAHDRFPLLTGVGTYATHDEALMVAQERIRRDGRGVSTDTAAVTSWSAHFPCPHDVFPDAVQIVRSGSFPFNRLRNADPFDVTVHHCAGVQSLYDAICQLEVAEDGIYHGGHRWGILYQLAFSQEGAEVLRLTVSPERPQFLRRSDEAEGRAYWTDERFWTALAKALGVEYEALFPVPQQ